MQLRNMLAMANQLALLRLKALLFAATLFTLLICCLALAATDQENLHDLVARFGLWLPVILVFCLAGWSFLLVKTSPALHWRNLAVMLVLTASSLFVSSAATRAFPHEMQRLALPDGTKFMLVTKFGLSSRHFELWQADRAAPHQWQALDGGKLTVPWYALSSPEPRLTLASDGEQPVILWNDERPEPASRNRLVNRKSAASAPLEG